MGVGYLSKDRYFVEENCIFCEFTKMEADYLDVRVRVLNFIKFTSILQKILPHNSKISATDNLLPVS